MPKFKLALLDHLIQRHSCELKAFAGQHAGNEDEIHSIATPDLGLEEQLATQQELDRLNLLLLELSAVTRNAFVLYRLEGLSHKEISLRLGISERSSVRLVAAAAHHLMLGFGAFQSD